MTRNNFRGERNISSVGLARNAREGGTRLTGGFSRNQTNAVVSAESAVIQTNQNTTLAVSNPVRGVFTQLVEVLGCSKLGNTPVQCRTSNLKQQTVHSRSTSVLEAANTRFSRNADERVPVRFGCSVWRIAATNLTNYVTGAKIGPNCTR